MKVFLVQDVTNLGKAGEIKEVKPGYAKNFLLRNGIAVLPNDKRAAEFAKIRKEKKEKEIQKGKENLAELEKIEGKKFTFKVKTDAKGKLYGSIGPKDLSEATGLSESLFSEHFKNVGKYDVKVTVDNKTVTFSVEITKEK